MTKTLTIIQIAVSFLLIITILLQQKGSGLGSAFGSDGGNVYSTRRGMEKVLFYATIFLAAVFIILSVVRIRL
ncbi:MAG: preprotein translocase subunit SecG [Candidatus Yanofskybacteria bacterium]|nr:preprotein translocase subunit SecG [Candidatus Yanofskybacteria bacterium]